MMNYRVRTYFDPGKMSVTSIVSLKVEHHQVVGNLSVSGEVSH